MSPSPTDNDASRRVLRERSRGDPVSETNVAVSGRSRTAVKGDSHAVVEQPESVERLFLLRADTEEGDSHDESDDGDDLEGRSPVLNLSVPPNAGEVDSDHGHPERGDVGRGRGGRVPEGDDDGTGGQLDRDRNSPRPVVVLNGRSTRRQSEHRENKCENQAERTQPSANPKAGSMNRVAAPVNPPLLGKRVVISPRAIMMR